MTDAPLIQIQRLSKAYGGVQALSDITMDVAAGEVHALCGENGAGKSTMIKVLTGVVWPEAGQILVRGQPLSLGNVHESEAVGIAAMHQESTAFPDLSTIDNIFVGRELRRGSWLLDRPAMNRQTQKWLERLGETFDIHRPVGELPLAQRQMVAMARALSRNCRLLIMDEPTASLSQRETDVLFGIIRQLRSDGVSVLYVSHRLEEVFEIADRVTVLRDGKHVATREVEDMDTAALIQLMVGRAVDTLSARQDQGKTLGPTVLSVSQLTRRGSFADISFQVRAGEILGLGGLVGAGRSEIVRAVFGADPYDAGSVTVMGRRLVGGSITAAIKAGIALVPEDRQHTGLVLPMSVGQNISLAILRQLTRIGLIDHRRERDVVDAQLQALHVQAASSLISAETLSGGNQQKLVLGKWLARRPKVLILDEPTRGVDVGAKAQVHELIRELASQGIAIVLISSELPELLTVSDRVLVLREGRVVGELDARSATQEQVLELALPDVTPS